MPSPKPVLLSPTTTTILTGTLLAGTLLAYTTIRHPIMAEPKEPQPPKTFTGFGLTSLTLESIEEVNHNTKRLRFALPTENHISGLPLTSSLLSITWPKGRWLPVPRPYTPVSDLTEPGSISFLIKHYPNGKASTHLHSLTPGSRVSFLPLKGAPWPPHKNAPPPAHITLIAGGAGITPLYQLIRGILSSSPPSPSTSSTSSTSSPQSLTPPTRLTLIWGVNTSSDIYLDSELSALQSAYPNRLEVFYTVSRDEGIGANERGFARGHVTAELLRNLNLANPGGPDGKGGEMVYVCGPPKMEEALVGKGGVLEELGYVKGQIVKF